MTSQSSWRSNAKWASCLRRVDETRIHHFERRMPQPGDLILCRVEQAAFPDSVVENRLGRLTVLFPGDLLLTTVADRESTRWTVGYAPDQVDFGTAETFAVLSVQGIVGRFEEFSSEGSWPSTLVSILGAAVDSDGRTLSIKQFSVCGPKVPCTAVQSTILVTGSSAEAGKTTAAISAIRLIMASGYSVAALKATGTASLIEKELFSDAGATVALDPVDFGFATTYSEKKQDLASGFRQCLDYVYSLGVDFAVIECGGDSFGANVPSFIQTLKALAPPLFHISAASDCVGALGLALHFQNEHLPVDFFCGRCVENTVLEKRVRALTGVAAGNLRQAPGIENLQNAMYTWASDTQGGRHALRRSSSDEGDGESSRSERDAS